MTPLIKSGEKVTVEPVNPAFVIKDDIVLAKVKGHLYLHLVLATDRHRVKIGNNHGHVNGWTNRSNIFGRISQT